MSEIEQPPQADPPAATAGFDFNRPTIVSLLYLSSFLLGITALIGFLILPAVAVLVIVRCVLSLVKAQKHEPMPNPDTWLA